MNNLKRLLIKEKTLSNFPFFPYTSKCFSEIRIGIFSILDKIRIQYSDYNKFFYKEEGELKQKFLQMNKDFCPSWDEFVDIKFSLTNENFLPWTLINNVSTVIKEDLSILLKSLPNYFEKIELLKKRNIEVFGPWENVFIHESAITFSGLCIDASKGEVVIDKGVKILPFTFLKGPVYIGQKSIIDGGRILDGSIIGNNSIIKGEVFNSIIGNGCFQGAYGGILHSVLGDNVKINVAVATACLKLDYNNVFIRNKSLLVDTGCKKFGAIISDNVILGEHIITSPGTFIRDKERVTIIKN